MCLAAALSLGVLVGCGMAGEASDEASATHDEGVDTAIEVVGSAAYTSAGDAYFLTEGDAVAVLSLSYRSEPEEVDATVEGLEGWGFVPVEGSFARAETCTLDECVEDLTWALENPDIKAIFCVRGGYGASEVMDAMPLELIASADKPIVGYSDVTVFHAAWTRAGAPSVHALMRVAFTDEALDACARAERDMMCGLVPTYRCEADGGCRQGRARGTLVGGNLSTFVATIGTAYDPTKSDTPYILFLEDVGENMRTIHRYLTVLKHAGVLERAAGIVFGEWAELPSDGSGNFGDSRGGGFASVEDMICRELLDGIDVPIAFGFPAGHGSAQGKAVNYPLLMGAPVTLDVTEGSYTLSWDS